MSASPEPGPAAGSMSYQARICIPPLIVTGRSGAFGKTKCTGATKSNIGTIGSKSWASAPRPCIQITVPVVSGPVSISTQSKAIDCLLKLSC